MELDRLAAMRGFVAVARKLSFAEAADTLDISASALSRRVGQLERTLGCRLLQRTTRSVALTEAGAAYLDRCLDVLSRVEEAEAAVSAFTREPQGVLRVALPNLYGQRCIAPLLPIFMERHPGLRLELSLSDRFVDLIDERFDVGVRIGDLQTGDYVARKLAPNKRVLCASPAYLEKHGAPGDVVDLGTHRCLHFQPLRAGDVWRLQRGARHVELPIEPALSADNAEVLRQAVLTGSGVALLATFLIDDDLEAGRLIRILPEWSVEESWVWAVFPNARFLPKKTRLFVDFLVEQLGPEGRGRPP